MQVLTNKHRTHSVSYEILLQMTEASFYKGYTMQCRRHTGEQILTTGDEAIAIAVENLEGQGVH